MTLTDAIILAVIQGLTEFLPVSSSGHLALAEHLRHMPDPEKNLLFVLILHGASLLAVFTYYGRRLLDVLKSRRELLYLALATLPILAVGALLGKQIEALQSMPKVICGALIVNAAFLFISERFRGDQPIGETPAWKIFLMGVAQAILIPGLSRSGRTIGTGWICGIKREDAVRFSFFMSIPAVLAALTWKLWKSRHELGSQGLPITTLLVSFVICYLLSLASIRVVEKLATGRKWLVFSIYCALAGTAALIYFFSKPA